jgi:hypothetical protein
LGAHHAMSFSEIISLFFGRCAFVCFYLTSAMDIVGHGIAADMAAKHVPIPPLVA